MGLISNGRIILGGVLKIQDMSCTYRIHLGEQIDPVILLNHQRLYRLRNFLTG